MKYKKELQKEELIDNVVKWHRETIEWRKYSLSELEHRTYVRGGISAINQVCDMQFDVFGVVYEKLYLNEILLSEVDIGEKGKKI